MYISRYEEDILKVGRKKTNLMFIGDGKGKTVISGGKSVQQNMTTFRTASFGKIIFLDYFYLFTLSYLYLHSYLPRLSRNYLGKTVGSLDDACWLVSKCTWLSCLAFNLLAFRFLSTRIVVKQINSID